jgi:hypothetical protein
VRTVFVIGAGANSEIRLPTGPELKEKISNLLNFHFEFAQLKYGDEVICSALRRHAGTSAGNFGTLVESAQSIRGALPLAISIDNLIDAHRGNQAIELCGKLAIVRSILEAESQSLLFFSNEREQIDFKKLEQTWYLPFFRLLTENCQREDLKARFSLVELVIFNYDRCVEHFLYFALMKYYGIGNAEAADIVNSTKIIHPYGTVGSLPFQDGTIKFQFGQGPRSSDLLQLANQIKTFTEGRGSNTEKEDKALADFRNANRIVFLGFAFHKQNLELLFPNLVFFPNDSNRNVIRCLGTAYQVSVSDQTVIKEALQKSFSGHLQFDIEDFGCYSFFGSFWRSLSF